MAKSQRVAMTDEERAESSQAGAGAHRARGRAAALERRLAALVEGPRSRRTAVGATRRQSALGRGPGRARHAGFRSWLGLGYCVRRGATSHIRVWAPCPPSKRKLKAWRDAGANPDDRPRTYFRFEAVFSQEQVEALPPPSEPAPLGPPVAEVQGSSLAWAREPLEALAAELGYSVTYCTPADRDRRGRAGAGRRTRGSRPARRARA